MDSSLQVFNNEDYGTIRALKVDGEPWFVAKDICDALGIATNHLREMLDDDEVSNLPIAEVGPEFGGRAPLIVSEPGMYALIMRSRKPEAKANDPYAHMTRKGLDYCMRTYCAQKAV